MLGHEFSECAHPGGVAMMGVAEDPQIRAELRREIEDSYKTGFRFAEIARQAGQADILADRRQEQQHAARPVHRIYPRGIGGELFHRRHLCEVIAACHEPVVLQVRKFCRCRVFPKVGFRSVDCDRQVPEPSFYHLVMAFRAGLQAVGLAQYRRAMNAERVGRSIQRAEMACRAKNSEVVPIQDVLHYCTYGCD